MSYTAFKEFAGVVATLIFYYYFKISARLSSNIFIDLIPIKRCVLDSSLVMGQ